MNFGMLWTMVGAIAITGIVAGVIGDVMKARAKSRVSGNDLQEAMDDLAARMEKIEDRMANIESIVVESDKHRRFDEAL
jgi:archaellum component FlaC